MNLKHVIKHVGNFCTEVAKGLIGYGREIEKGRSHINASYALPASDGYATRESDITLGGLLRIRAAQMATQKGTHLSALNVQEKQNLAFRIVQDHLRQHGTVNREHYKHWLIRVKRFAELRNIILPPQNSYETNHNYFRRLRTWVREQPISFPELRPAAGTHLIFSPDPEIWESFREKGIDERLVLNNILGRTLKEFSDWRRKQFGPGHSIGWVAGTHVCEDGADRHPHIHLIVIKRDETGQEVDLSVSCLKNYQGRDHPDPIRELKRLFAKHIEKECERFIGKELNFQNQPKRFQKVSPDLGDKLVRGLRRIISVFRAMNRITQPHHFPRVGHSSGWGKLLRITAIAQARTSNSGFPIPGQSIHRIFHHLVQDHAHSSLEPTL